MRLEVLLVQYCTLTNVRYVYHKWLGLGCLCVRALDKQNEG